MTDFPKKRRKVDLQGEKAQSLELVIIPKCLCAESKLDQFLSCLYAIYSNINKQADFAGHLIK